MRIAEEIAKEIYQIYSSGKCGIALVMEHKQEAEPVIDILQKEYFKGKTIYKICNGEKKVDEKIVYGPEIYQSLSVPRRIPDDELELENVQRGCYLAAALEKLAVGKGVSLIIIEDYHLFSDEEIAKSLSSLTKNLKIGRNDGMALILLTVGKQKNIPADLLPYVHMIYGRKPDIAEIREKVEQILSRKKMSLGENFKREIISYLQGFQCYEMEYLFKRAEMLYGRDAFDEKKKSVLELIGSEKVKLLERQQLLEWKMVKQVNIANMENLAEYLEESGKIMGNLEDAVKSGADVPKGILILGLPGTGKSLFAQYAAYVLKMPLIRLEMGRMMGGHVGDSERNLREAQRQAEEMAPCILWIDEIEKGFSGSGDGGREEGAYLHRMVGGFLTWLQEKKSSCYIIATANKIEGMPSDLFRKCRFDECFYTLMPSERELKEILKVHLLRPERAHVAPAMDHAVCEIIRIASADKRFMTGADASALVSNTFRRLYLDYQGDKKKKTIDKKEYDRKYLADIMIQEFKKMKVYSETNGKDIAKYDISIRKSNFRPASASSTSDDGEICYGYDKNLESFIITEIGKLKYENKI